VISFIVLGQPIPQGSKRLFGKALVESNQATLKPWRQEIALAAHHAMLGGPWREAVAVRLAFFLPRPKMHFGSGRNSSQLKPSAPTVPATRPDIDKLSRAVLDALTGIVFSDDAQVADLQAHKFFADAERPVGVRVVCVQVDGIAPQLRLVDSGE
jgi:Holliday junction resolvase RusA-like endonuclease